MPARVRTDIPRAAVQVGNADHNVCVWHFADIAQSLHDFRFRGLNGHPGGYR